MLIKIFPFFLEVSLNPSARSVPWESRYKLLPCHFIRFIRNIFELFSPKKQSQWRSFWLSLVAINLYNCLGAWIVLTHKPFWDAQLRLRLKLIGYRHLIWLKRSSFLKVDSGLWENDIMIILNTIYKLFKFTECHDMEVS